MCGADHRPHIRGPVSVTAPQDKKIQAAIAAIPESVWGADPVLALHPGRARRGRGRDTPPPHQPCRSRPDAHLRQVQDHVRALAQQLLDALFEQIAGEGVEFPGEAQAHPPSAGDARRRVSDPPVHPLSEPGLVVDLCSLSEVALWCASIAGRCCPVG